MTLKHKRNHKPIGNPDGQNVVRSGRGYAAIHGMDHDTPGRVLDVLVNLAHYCDREGIDFAVELDKAKEVYGQQTRAANAGECNGAQFDRIEIRRRKL
jgi:hypothetical protein